MAAAVPILMAASAVIGMGVSVKQAQDQKRAGEEAEAWSRYNAEVLDKQGKEQEQVALFEANRAREEANRLRARQRALYARSGVMSTTGAPLLAMAESAANEELDIAMVLRESSMKTSLYSQRAQESILKGKSAKKQAKSAATGTLLSGIGSTIGTFGSIYSKR